MRRGSESHGQLLRRALSEGEILAAIGIYDTFSASVAARRADALFVSGFSFAASFYGLPDVGLIAWSDIVAFVQRVRMVVPDRHLIVDIDDGYGDDQVAAHVTRLLRTAGASAVILEDQRRPRRCGHMDGKLLLALDDYLRRLEAVRAQGDDLVVIARTDAADPDEIRRRVRAAVAAGADAVLVDGVRQLDLLDELTAMVDRPLVFNQLAGGKSPEVGLEELAGRGVALVLYSTAALFTAQYALDEAVGELLVHDGRLDTLPRSVTLHTCDSLLTGNLNRLSSLDSSSAGSLGV